MRPFGWLAAIVTAAALPASAQDFPTKPIRIIAPFGPGTATDTVAHEIARAVHARHLAVHQDAAVYVAELRAGELLHRQLAPNRPVWIQICRGNLDVSGQSLSEGDGAAISDEQRLSFTGKAPDGCEFLLFDLP